MKICSTADCDRKVHGKGLCNYHYVEYRKTIVPKCSAEDCERPSRSRGMCTTHYDQVLRAEDENIDYDDFWEFVKREVGIA